MLFASILQKYHHQYLQLCALFTPFFSMKYDEFEHINFLEICQFGSCYREIAEITEYGEKNQEG